MRPCSIYSRSLDRNARELSNLTPHAFEFEGVQCASMEGFLQALKYTDPLEQLKVAVELLYEASRPDPTAKRPLFTDFAPRLLVSHPSEVKVAHAPLLALLTELMEEASEAGQLRTGINPRRMAAMTMQTVMFVAQSSGGTDEASIHPITADEVWDFVANGFAAS